MFKLELKSVSGETLIVPFIYALVPKRNYLSMELPFTLYESFSEQWIPTIPINEIPDSGIVKQYNNEKNNSSIRLSYGKVKNNKDSSEYARVSVSIYINNSYKTSLGTYNYTKGHFSPFEFPPVLFIDAKNHYIGYITCGKNIISDITYDAGKDYTTLGDTNNFMTTNDGIFVQKKTYNSLNVYFKDISNPTGYTHITTSDDGKYLYTEGYFAYLVGDGYDVVKLYDDFFSGTKPPLYPDSDDDPEDDDDDPTDPTPGDGDTTSDPIPIPPKPTIDVTGTGFVTLYNPSVTDIRELAYFMWSGEFIDVLKKMFSAPFDCLIGLKLLYAPLTTGASQKIWLGNVESTVSAPKITDQFTDFDCGSIQLAGYFGSFLDYAPYTKVTIFLPFIGYKELNVDEVMNATLHLTYRVDAYSGSCVAFLHVSKKIGSTNLNSVIYEFDGNAAMDIPFTSGDMSRYVQAVLGTAASTAGAVISMGAGAKLSTSSVPQTSTDPWTKNPMEKKTVTGLADLGNGSAELEAGKPHIQRGGSLAGANASMAIKQPYIIIERPMQQMPSDYASFIGIPLNMSKPLSSFSGFTVVSQIFMASSSATDDELNMIDSLLRQGVII